MQSPSLFVVTGRSLLGYSISNKSEPMVLPITRRPLTSTYACAPAALGGGLYFAPRHGPRRLVRLPVLAADGAAVAGGTFCPKGIRSDAAEDVLLPGELIAVAPMLGNILLLCESKSGNASFLAVYDPHADALTTLVDTSHHAVPCCRDMRFFGSHKQGAVVLLLGKEGDSLYFYHIDFDYFEKVELNLGQSFTNSSDKDISIRLRLFTAANSSVVLLATKEAKASDARETFRYDGKQSCWFTIYHDGAAKAITEGEAVSASVAAAVFIAVAGGRLNGHTCTLLDYNSDASCGLAIKYGSSHDLLLLSKDGGSASSGASRIAVPGLSSVQLSLGEGETPLYIVARPGFGNDIATGVAALDAVAASLEQKDGLTDPECPICFCECTPVRSGEGDTEQEQQAVSTFLGGTAAQDEALYTPTIMKTKAAPGSYLGLCGHLLHYECTSCNIEYAEKNAGKGGRYSGEKATIIAFNKYHCPAGCGRSVRNRRAAPRWRTAAAVARAARYAASSIIMHDIAITKALRTEGKTCAPFAPSMALAQSCEAAMKGLKGKCYDQDRVVPSDMVDKIYKRQAEDLLFYRCANATEDDNGNDSYVDRQANDASQLHLKECGTGTVQHRCHGLVFGGYRACARAAAGGEPEKRMGQLLCSDCQARHYGGWCRVHADGLVDRSDISADDKVALLYAHNPATLATTFLSRACAVAPDTREELAPIGPMPPRPLFKCRFCCNPAASLYFGTYWVCQRCDDTRWSSSTLPAVLPCPGPGACPLGGHHGEVRAYSDEAAGSAELTGVATREQLRKWLDAKAGTSASSSIDEAIYYIGCSSCAAVDWSLIDNKAILRP